MLRLPIKHIHRAFPELDRYSDEQCIRFIHAARGTMLRRAIAMLVILTIFVVGTIAGGIILLTVVNTLLPPGHSRSMPLGRGLIMLFLLLICTAAGPILAFLMRDFLIIDRIRWILRSRGLCQSCSYSLIGLVVSPDNSVTCPECATLCTVDPSMGELTTGDGGTTHFKPDEASHVKAPFLQRIPDSIKFAARVTSRVALVLLCVLAVLALAFEATIQWQAGRARATNAEIRADLARLGPPDSSQDALAIHLVDEAVARFHATFERIRAEHWKEAYEHSPMYFDPNTVHPYARSRTINPLAESQIAAMRKAAALTIDQSIHDPEVIRLLKAIHASQILLSFDGGPIQGPLIHATSTHHGFSVYTLVGILEACAETARIENDRTTFMLSIESLLAIDRLLARPISVTDLHTSVYARRVISIALLGMLTRGMPGNCLDELHVITHRHGYWESSDLDVKALHLAMGELVSYYFGAAGRFRLGTRSGGYKRFSEDYWGQHRPVTATNRIGTFRENREAVDRYCADLADVLRQPAALTAYLAKGVWTPTTLILVDLYAFDPSFFLTSVDLTRINTAGFRIQLAIERFQHDRERLPESLEQLVPEYLDAIPIDHWGDGVFRYIRIDREKDEHNRAYLLYSVGADEQDDGGTPHPDRARESFLLTKPVNSAFIGFDYVINDPSR